MEDRESRKERFLYFNTLKGLVKALENHRTIIDLRNESSVSGLIESADSEMNVEMTDAIFYDNRGREHTFENFYINGRNIRYVHMPEGFSGVELFNEFMSKRRRSGNVKKQSNPKQTFKKKRAQQYQEEILRENYGNPGPSTA